MPLFEIQETLWPREAQGTASRGIRVLGMRQDMLVSGDVGVTLGVIKSFTSVLWQLHLRC